MGGGDQTSYAWRQAKSQSEADIVGTDSGLLEIVPACEEVARIRLRPTQSNPD
jgi:hypothetical protein